MNDDCTQLDWKPILLVKVTRLPFGDMHTGLSVKRLYLAQHPEARNKDVADALAAFGGDPLVVLA